MTDTHYYEVNLHWDFETMGTLSSPVTPDKIEVGTPAEFPKGMKEKWTPEHLFVAAVSSCLMSTFLLVADNSKLEVISFESNATGTIEKVDGKLAVTEIILKPVLILPSTQKEEKAKRILDMSEKACAISNSIKTKITLQPIKNMSIIDALNWRYATKRMNGNIIRKEKMDVILKAIALAPSSLGLQPYSVIVIENKSLLEEIKPIANMQPQITEASALLVFAAWDNLTQERIDAYIKRISTVRNDSEDSLKRIKGMMEAQLKNTAEQNFSWNARQAYIAMGIGLVAAAEGNIDSTPMEGFDQDKMDEILQLKGKGFKSVVLLALGYRDEANDYLVKLKKVRRENEKLFTIMT